MLRIKEISKSGTIYLIGDVDLRSEGEVLSAVDREGRFFVNKTNVEGIFTYGIQNTKPDCFGHDVGYTWSSRSSVMNKVFDVALIDVLYDTSGYCFRTCAIDLAHLEPLLEDTEWKIDWEPRVDHTDITYRIVKR